MNARDVRAGTVVDAIAWARHALLVVMSTPPGSPERRAKLEELTQAVARARALAEIHDGRLATELRLALRATEAGLRYLAGRRVTRRAGNGHGVRDPADRESETARPPRHPRRALRGVRGDDETR